MKFLFAIALWLALAVSAHALGYPWRLGQRLPAGQRFLVMFGIVLPGLGILGMALLSFALAHFMGRPHDWTQTTDWSRFPSGEKLISQSHYRSAFVQTMLLTNCLFIQWANGTRELVVSRDHYSSVNHYAFSKNGDDYVIGVGRTVYYRPKTAPAGHWNSWTLTGSQEIYNFIKHYLDVHSPGAWASYTNESAPAGAIEIRCNDSYVQAALIIAPHSFLPPGAYEIGAIRNQGRELIAVPFGDNPFAPQKLVFLRDVDSAGWRFDEKLTAAANKP